MPVETPLLDPSSVLLRTYSCFQSLIQCSGPANTPDPNLGGILLYAGELDGEGSVVVLAGNIAGCATLAATVDAAAQKQAIRDGVIDFLVTSLDEALRILKNEIRKKGTVAVCVATSPDAIEREMLERGVQPDLTRAAARLTTAQQVDSFDAASDPMRAVTIVWQVDSSPARWLPKLDGIALDCFDPADAWNRRWLRLLPRYTGRVAPNLRLVCADREFASKFVERLRSFYDRGETLARATVLVRSNSLADEYNFAPSGLS